ncbi:MAG: hypothetical protein J1F39_03330 [Clostridiales bacterium]|nr:hypothetical protein [Clostridiales bacterium]
MSKSVKTIRITPDVKARNIVLETVFAIAVFVAPYLALVSSLPFNAAYYAALPIGAAAAALSILFYEKKHAKFFIIGGALLVTVVCIAVFPVFKNGLLTFFNGAVKTINSTRHEGLATFTATESFGASFLFALLIAVWFGVFGAFSVKYRYLYVGAAAVILSVQLFIGLYPQYYTVVLLVVAFVGLLALHNGFKLKAIAFYIAVVAVVALATLPCYFFNGSAAVDDFRDNIADSFENAVYGTSMPSGKLSASSGMRGYEGVRLNVTMSRLTPTLYLRGFIGSTLNGAQWSPTDKNAYVENGYQGLLDYIGEGGLPTVQYATYSNLTKRNNRYSVTVENVSADKRYVYAPYTLSNYTVGSAYYDLGLRVGAYTRSYTYTVFAGDESGERVTQAAWITEEANRSEGMQKYIELEGQYRAFVYDTYLTIDEKSRDVVLGAVGDFETDSINTATQFIRAYFLDGYSYADKSDEVKGSFIPEFFDGSLRRGNSAYFASAATYMFRALGFPARYVEGYVVRADDGESETVSVAVTGDSTHAWTEVYFDGIGWLPIEVTPTFFVEQPPDVTVDPNDPEIGGAVPSDPSESTPGTPDDEEPDVPDVPPDKPKPHEPVKPEKKDPLLVALEIIVPILAAVCALVLIAFAFALNRHSARTKRRTALNKDGAEFGREAYRIVVRDCKLFGGFGSEELEKFGVDPRSTARFTRIVEQCVYGERDPNDNERTFVLWYIASTQKALLSSCGFFRKLYYKYVRCVVI